VSISCYVDDKQGSRFHVALPGVGCFSLQSIQVVSQIAEGNNVVTEIAASTVEQATALQQVNTAVGQMDQVTQQNTAMVEETTAATYSLGQEANQLTHLVGQFALSGSGAPQRSDTHRGREQASHRGAARTLAVA
jgi:hypothetical protein